MRPLTLAIITFHMGFSGLFHHAEARVRPYPLPPSKEVRASLDPNTQCEGDVCVLFEVVIKNESPPTANRKYRVVNKQFTYGSLTQSYSESLAVAANGCSKNVTVPKAIFVAIANIIRNTLGDGDVPVPALTPAQQTIFLFYSTVMQQTLSMTCASLG